MQRSLYKTAIVVFLVVKTTRHCSLGYFLGNLASVLLVKLYQKAFDLSTGLQLVYQRDRVDLSTMWPRLEAKQLLWVGLGMFNSPSLYSWRSRSYPFPNSFAAAHFCKVDLLEGRAAWQKIAFLRNRIALAVARY